MSKGCKSFTDLVSCAQYSPDEKYGDPHTLFSSRCLPLPLSTSAQAWEMISAWYLSHHTFGESHGFTKYPPGRLGSKFLFPVISLSLLATWLLTATELYPHYCPHTRTPPLYLQVSKHHNTLLLCVTNSNWRLGDDDEALRPKKKKRDGKQRNQMAEGTGQRPSAVSTTATVLLVTFPAFSQSHHLLGLVLFPSSQTLLSTFSVQRHSFTVPTAPPPR